jgi:hypothetical protein
MSQVFMVSYISTWGLVLLQTALLLLVFRHFGLLALSQSGRLSVGGLAIGDIAPPINVNGAGDEMERAAWVPRTRYLYLLAFVSPDCSSCATIIPEINRLATTTGHLDVLFVVRGPREVASRLHDSFHVPWSNILQDPGEAYEQYRVRVTPFAFVVGGDGYILAQGVCSDLGRLHKLMAKGGMDIFPHPLLPMSGRPL